MTYDSRRRRRVAAGLVTIAVGAIGVVAGVAPAGAWEGDKEPHPQPETRNLSCAALATIYGIPRDTPWIESKVDAAALPAEGESADIDLTPDDAEDDAVVTITTTHELKAFDWVSTVGIDAVYVKGGHGSAFYGYEPEVDAEGEIVGPGEEAFEGTDHGTFPYWADDEPSLTENQISHVELCWDGEGPPPGASTTTSTTSTTTPCPPDGPAAARGAPPEGDDECPPTTTVPTTTSTTVPVEPPPSTTPPPPAPATTLPVTPVSGELPRTGSNSTTPLVLGGLALVAVGIVLVAGTRFVRRS